MMNINFNKLKSHKPEIKLADSGSTIGSIVRWQRKSKNMTLNEGAEGICSISYLSKVENSLIEPSSEILENLKKRFGLENLLDFDIKRYQEHYSDIVSKLFFFKEIPVMYRKIYDNQTDYKSKMIMYAYYINSGNITKGKILFSEIEIELGKLTHDEVNLFFYLTARLLAEEGRFYKGYQILKLTNVLDENSYLSLLVDYEKLRLKLLLGRFLQVNYLFNDLERRLLNNNYLERYQKLKDEMFLLSLNEFEYENRKNHIRKNKKTKKEDKQMLQTALDILNDKKVNIDKLIANNNLSPRWYLLALLALDEMEDYEGISKLIQTSINSKANPIIEQIEFFVENKYRTDHESFIRFIRQMTFNYKTNFNGVYVINQLFNNAALYYENKSFYKSANLIRKYKNNLVMELKKSNE